ncbi:MAG: GNAT family N-acetyltransferase [Alphaproteobacteria bacterium]|nr:GNAT family N-acetyltransferase [Alphaproteobacteria bacterium]
MSAMAETAILLPRPPAEPAAQAPDDARSRRLGKEARLSVVVEQDAAGLERHLQAWEDLSTTALEPNVFYEPWLLRPALRHLRGGADLVFVLVYAQMPGAADQPSVLCGFFPLERLSHYKNLPVSALRLWKHVHCFLSSPLVRAETAQACFQAVFDWAATDPRGSILIEFGDVSGDGPLWKAFVEFLEDRRDPTLMLECSTRALLRPRADATSYLDAALSPKKRRTLRQQESALRRQGALEYAMLAGDGDIDGWIENFLRLEASGWKGREGTALSCNPAQKQFFAETLREAFRRGRLMMLAQTLDGRPIAQLCNFLCRNGSFAFKVAFDEAYARFSPGVLLELENIAEVHRHAWIRWMDSCSSPGPSLTKQLWLDRRIVQTILATSGRSPGPFLISVLPFMQWTFHKVESVFRRRRR